MSITYEEALSTLKSMFSAPWTEDDLDTVLRHFEGHMENTVDSILAHGEGTPQELLNKLSSSKVGPDQIEQDAELAQRIATEQNQSRESATRNTPGVAPSTITSPQTSAKKGRGLPTQLPEDFLRIPGQDRNAMEDDGALARMLQDKLFSEELRNNPEFAHLARGSRGGNPFSRGEAAPARNYPGMGRGGGNQQQGPSVIDAISGMGENAKKRLQDIANRFKTNNNRGRNTDANPGRVGESRGLLDGNDEQEISFNNDDYEMSSMSTSGGKKRD